MGTGLEGAFLVGLFTSTVSLLSGIGEAQSQKSRSESAKRQAEESSRGMQLNISDGMAKVPLVYGQLRVGLNREYVDTTGAKNDDIHIIGQLSEGEVQGALNVYADDKLHNDASYKGLIHYEFFTGTPTQNVCATLNAAIPSWILPMRYSSYIYVRITYDRAAFQDLPEITVEMQGIKVYDPRSGLTAYSNNPALIVRDLLTRSSKRGGMGVAASRIDDTTIGDCATYCESKGWTCNIRFSANEPVIDNITQVLATFRGDVIFSDSKFKLRYRDYALESSVMTLSEADVKCDAAGRSSLVITQPSIFDTPNAMRAKYVSPAKKYQYDEFVLPDPAAIASDGDYREGTVDLVGVTDFNNVGKLTSYELARRRVNKEVSFLGGMRCARLEPLDLVRLTHSVPGWSQKVLRTMDVSMSFNSDVCVKFIEESADLYYETYSMADHVWRDTNLPDPSGTIPGVHNVTVTEELYNYGGRTFTRLVVNFDGPAPEDYPWWKYAEVWVSVGDVQHYKYMTASSSDYMIDPAQEGVTYFITLVGVSIFDAKQDFTAGYAVSHLVMGKTALPSDPRPLTAVAAGDTVTLITQDITDPDVDGYEARYGETWNAGLLLAFTRSASIRLTGIKPGAYTFWLGVKDNRGRYNANKRSANCTVLYPSGYSNKNTWNWNFSTGTHNGTCRRSFGGNSVLQISRGNICSNGGFESSSQDWSAQNQATIQVVGGGYSGSCLQITGGAIQWGCAVANFALTIGRQYTCKYRYKNTAGDVFQFGVWDATNAQWIITGYDKPNTQTWSSEQSDTFTVPANCYDVWLCFYAKNTGDVVWLDEVQLIDDSTALTATWTSPEYDLGSVKTIRCWGDFLSQFVASNMTWAGVFGSNTWEGAVTDFTTKRWFEIFVPAQAAQIAATIYWGNSSGSLTNSAQWFQLLSPEFTARYVKVEITITDPTIDALTYLKTLNMIGAYWQ